MPVESDRRDPSREPTAEIPWKNGRVRDGDGRCVTLIDTTLCSVTSVGAKVFVPRAGCGSLFEARFAQTVRQSEIRSSAV